MSPYQRRRLRARVLLRARRLAGWVKALGKLAAWGVGILLALHQLGVF